MKALSKSFRIFLNRLLHVEYWPFWVFYGPFIPAFLFYGLKNGHILHFLAVNPGIKNSGCFNFSKYSVLQQLPERFLPKGVLIKREERFDFSPQSSGFTFPLIVKPDRGNRGRGVVLVHNSEELANALSKDYDYIIQEYIDYPLEFGVFYFHNAKTGEKGITGITAKKFLEVTGDGKHTLGEILSEEPRAKPNLTHFGEKFASQWNKILPKGEELLIEEIGNHNRGTQFIDASDLITDSVEKLFFDLANHVDGFYWGRFDVKAKTKQDLVTGNYLKVLEVNGGSSEPSHMFDPKYNWFSVAKFILYHLRLHYGVAKANLENGAEIPKWKSVKKEVKQYFNNKRLQID